MREPQSHDASAERYIQLSLPGFFQVLQRVAVPGLVGIRLILQERNWELASLVNQVVRTDSIEDPHLTSLSK